VYERRRVHPPCLTISRTDDAIVDLVWQTALDSTHEETEEAVMKVFQDVALWLSAEQRNRVLDKIEAMEPARLSTKVVKVRVQYHVRDVSVWVNGTLW
jgi:hypothetical protein